MTDESEHEPIHERTQRAAYLRVVERDLAWYKDACSILGFDDPVGNDTNPLKDVLARLLACRDALEESCFTCNLPFEPDNPSTSLHRLLDWSVEIALNPQVSGDAQGLMDQGASFVGEYNEYYFGRMDAYVRLMQLIWDVDGVF